MATTQPTNTKKPLTAVAPQTRRMTLASVRAGRAAAPHRIALYGVEGIGKTSFGAGAPKPIFLGSEDGTGELDVARFPRPETWDDVHDAVRTLTDEAHGYETFVLDSLDWAEPLCWAEVCRAGGKQSIEDFGFGKGYIEALSEWRKLISALEQMQAKRGLHVVLIAHAHLKTFRNPLGEDFDRWTMKLHEKTGGAIREWAETVLFANWETFTNADSKGSHKGFSTGRRVLYTTKTAAYEAKNRVSLPEEIDLSWSAFAAAVERNRNAAEEIRKLLAGEPEKLAAFESWLKAAPRPVHELVAQRDRLLNG